MPHGTLLAHLVVKPSKYFVFDHLSITIAICLCDTAHLVRSTYVVAIVLANFALFTNICDIDDAVVAIRDVTWFAD
jgi:hypothetical protein